MSKKRKRQRFKFGVEYTFVPTAKFNEKSQLDVSDVAKNIYRKLNAWNGHDDGGAAEIPSRPMTDIVKHKRWAEMLFQEAKKAYLIPRRVDILPNGDKLYYGTGGGHIHVEPPEVSGRRGIRFAAQQEYSNRMYKFFLEHPYIGWMMNEYMDDDNAQTIQFMLKHFHRDSREQFWDFMNGTRLKSDFMGNLSKVKVTGGDAMDQRGKPGGLYDCLFVEQTRHYSYGSKISTTEFRFFDAPRTVKQSLEHIKLAKAIHTLVLSKRAIPPSLSGWTRIKYSNGKYGDWMRFAKSEYRMRDEWTNLLKALGLNPRIYMKYFQNYLDRRDYGRLV